MLLAKNKRLLKLNNVLYATEKLLPHLVHHLLCWWHKYSSVHDVVALQRIAPNSTYGRVVWSLILAMTLHNDEVRMTIAKKKMKIAIFMEEVKACACCNSFSLIKAMSTRQCYALLKSTH